MSNFIIVLFKNRKKRKIIKRYSTEKKATDFYKVLINKNTKILFDKKVENATPSSFHIALLTNKTNVQDTLYFVDDMGRNNVAKLDNENYVFLKIDNYKLEEKIYDYQSKTKIGFDEFLNTYCKNSELKNIFTLNNKICVQVNEEISIFSTKEIEECHRFLDILEKFFYQNSRNDAIFVRDVSITQRKWVYNVLTEKGHSKRNLYRHKTTFSKR